jgi:site-specific recombinase XerD
MEIYKLKRSQNREKDNYHRKCLVWFVFLVRLHLTVSTLLAGQLPNQGDNLVLITTEPKGAKVNQKPKNYCLTQDRILGEAELKKMLREIRPHMERACRTKTHVHFINDYFLILFGSLTGMRVSEVANLKIADLSGDSINVIGKGNKLRSVPLGKRGRQAIQELLKLKKEILNQSTESNQRLFLNRNRNPFTRFSIERRFTYWKRKCGINRRLNYHSQRHYFSCYVLNHGFLIHELQKFLGHSSVSTTSQYLHFTKETKERVDSAL